MNIETYEEAKKIFLHYNGSYFHMQRERYLEQYMKFNISKKEERKWLKEKVEKILSKITHFIEGAGKKPREGVKVIMYDGKIQSVMPFKVLIK